MFTTGQAHALQGVTLNIPANGILAMVGRNGMGKTTLCNTIMGIVPGNSGSVLINNTDVLGLNPYQIVDLGVGYVPQGRRVWPSLTVDEHLRLAAKKDGAWTLERLYATFPRLKERRLNGGNQLSGGEQQMLAIGRALLTNPRLLIMDEPTEGLAPIIVEQVEKLISQIVEEEGITVFLVEQNLGVALRISQRIAIMVNGRIAVELDTDELAKDKKMQQQLLGIAGSDEKPDKSIAEEDADLSARADSASDYDAGTLAGLGSKINRFSFGNPLVKELESPISELARVKKFITRWDGAISSTATDLADDKPKLNQSISHDDSNMAYVVGTFDTKSRELFFVHNLLEQHGINAITVDLSTSGQPSTAEIIPSEVAQSHPDGSSVVFTGDRGTAVTEMAIAFRHFLTTKNDVAGIVGLGGSGGTALATPAIAKFTDWRTQDNGFHRRLR